MRVSKGQSPSSLGRRTLFSLKQFNIESIYFSDDRIDDDIMYAETVSFSMFTKGLRIRTASVDGHYNIDIEYGELQKIIVVDPDESVMPFEKDSDRISNVLMGWAGGMRSLHDITLRIGGRVEFYYKDDDTIFEVTLHHSKQGLFDLFKFVRRHYGKFLLDNSK